LCAALGINADQGKKANHKNKETDCIENKENGSTIGREKSQGLIREGFSETIGLYQQQPRNSASNIGPTSNPSCLKNRTSLLIPKKTLPA
jgi:hypothetical protein